MPLSLACAVGAVAVSVGRMQNLRDQLLKAGLITKEQSEKAGLRGRHAAREPRRDRGDRSDRGDRRDPGAVPEKIEAPANAGKEALHSAAKEKPKFSKKELRLQPVNRMLDLSDPGLLRIFQAIEEHRVRGEISGNIPFHFCLRGGRVRKIAVSQETFDGLESGALAIVEFGEENKHVIVLSAAVPMIREADAEAIRFHNT